MAVIYISYKMKLNPDNVATPLAASIGDVCSLLLLSSWATLLYNIHGNSLTNYTFYAFIKD